MEEKFAVGLDSRVGEHPELELVAVGFKEGFVLDSGDFNDLAVLERS